MSIENLYYPGTNCDNEVPDHVCNPCEDAEKGRIRDAAFINKSIIDTIRANPADTAAWQDGIATGLIKIIPEITGTSNGGDKVTGPGYGDRKERVTGRDYVVAFKDPNYKNNCEFYTELEKSSSWHFAYKTETLLHISDKKVTTFAKNPTEEGVDTDVVWDVEVAWTQRSPVCPVDAPEDIFDCFSIIQ